VPCLHRSDERYPFIIHPVPCQPNQRDIKALVQEIGSWNEMIAALGGGLKDLLGDGPLGVQSAITQYQNFEQLELAGQDKLPPGYQKLFKLIGQVGQEVPATCA
jgi:hypothetical protein